MLVLSRKSSQSIKVGSDIRITIVKIDRNSVRIGIQAPDGVTIYREEILENATSFKRVPNEVSRLEAVS